MSSLKSVGKAPDGTDPDSIETRIQVENQFNAGVTRAWVAARAHTLAAPKATKLDVDQADALYAEPTYYQQKDALLVPTTSKGVANGVGTLDATGKMPIGQTPVLGDGLLKGPYGITSVNVGNTTTTPMKIAGWTLGSTALHFRPLVYMSVSIGVELYAKPHIEVRIGTLVQTAYEDQTLVAYGSGRAAYNDYQTVTVMPASLTNEMQDGVQTYYDPNASYIMTAWLFDTAGAGRVIMAENLIATASAWLEKVAM